MELIFNNMYVHFGKKWDLITEHCGINVCMMDMHFPTDTAGTNQSLATTVVPNTGELYVVCIFP